MSRKQKLADDRWARMFAPAPASSDCELRDHLAREIAPAFDSEPPAPATASSSAAGGSVGESIDLGKLSLFLPSADLPPGSISRPPAPPPPSTHGSRSPSSKKRKQGERSEQLTPTPSRHTVNRKSKANWAAWSARRRTDMLVCLSNLEKAGFVNGRESAEIVELSDWICWGAERLLKEGDEALVMGNAAVWTCTLVQQRRLSALGSFGWTAPDADAQMRLSYEHIRLFAQQKTTIHYSRDCGGGSLGLARSSGARHGPYCASRKSQLLRSPNVRSVAEEEDAAKEKLSGLIECTGQILEQEICFLQRAIAGGTLDADETKIASGAIVEYRDALESCDFAPIDSRILRRAPPVVQNFSV